MSSENEQPHMPVVRVVRYSNGKLRAGAACAFLKRGGTWGYSNPSNRFFAAGPVRDEILAALKQAGPKHEYYTIGLRQFIVLYPEYITREDLQMSIPASSTSGAERFYSTWLELPFGDTKKRVQIIVDPEQSVPLVTSLDDREAHVL